MKYICVVSTDGTGGVWSVVRESLTILKKDYEIKLVIYVRNNDLKPNVLDFLKNEKIEFLLININLKNGWLFDLGKALSVYKLKRFVGKEKVIIHSHDAFTAGSYLAFLKSPQYKLFCTFHGTLIYDGSFKSRVQNFLNRYVRIRLIEYSKAHLISCDPFSVSLLQTYFRRKRNIHVALNGVGSSDASIHNTKSVSRVFTIGYISRFHPLKRWDIVAKACELLHERGMNIRVVFAGNGPCSGDVEMWCKEHTDYSVFMGQIQDIRKDIFPILDLHVLPTMYPEGLPMIILETMSAGIPSITTGMGSNTYAVENGVNGFIIHPDFEEVADRIADLLLNENLYNQMSKNCLNIWHQKFSSETMASHYKYIFNKYL